MFKHILVPLDGSMRAESAVPVAARIARSAGGSVTLLRVVTPPVDFSWDAMGYPLLVQEALDTGFDNATEYLATIAKLEVLTGVETAIEVLSGNPALSIVSDSHSSNIDLIVMCSHGETGFKRWMLGSVAQKVARHSPVPVLVLREGGSTPAADGTRSVRIMVPVDGSAFAEKALEPAAQISAALSAPAQGELHLARVLRLPEMQEDGSVNVVTDASKQVIADAKTYLSAVEQRLQGGDLAHLNLLLSASVAIDTDIAEMLIEMAEEGEYLEGGEEICGCDMIAMATHGRSGPERWVMGSISERILGATRLPLLLVRPEHAVLKQQQLAAIASAEAIGVKV